MATQVYALTSNAEEVEVEWFCEDPQDLLELTPKKDVLFIIGDRNGKVGSQEIPRVTGKFGLGVQNESGQRLIEFCQENTLLRLLQIKTSGIPGFQCCSEFFILLLNKWPSTSLQ